MESEPGKLIARVVSAALRRSGKTREEIAAAMTQDVNQLVTKAMLDAWASESKSARLRFPACFVDSFCRAVDGDELKYVLLGAELRNLLWLRELKRELRALLRELRRRRGHKKKSS